MISEFDKWSAAFCTWREARGESATLTDSLRGVLHVIANRSAKRNLSWSQVVYQYLQFSSITAPGDPQIKAGIVPSSGDSIFAQCYQIADDIASGSDADLTQGASNYFADGIPVPSWAASMQFTIKIGRHSFYKET
jgi:spore germination cell wall hydrolase CwlJ-like protein